MKKNLYSFLYFLFLMLGLPSFSHSQSTNSSLFNCLSSIDSNERFPIYENRIFRVSNAEEARAGESARRGRNTFDQNRIGRNVLYGPNSIADGPHSSPPMTALILNGNEAGKEYFYIANSTGTFRVERRNPGPTFVSLGTEGNSGVVLDIVNGQVDILYHNNGSGSGGIGIRDEWRKYYEETRFIDNFAEIAKDRGSTVSRLSQYTSPVSQNLFKQKIEEAMNETVVSFRNQLNAIASLTPAQASNLRGLNLSNGQDPRSFAAALLERYKQGYRACTSVPTVSERANETIEKLEAEFNSKFGTPPPVAPAVRGTGVTQ